VIKRLSLPADRRILVISDIHGKLEYLRGLLRAADFGREDVLILLGDLVEKGPDSLAALRCIMGLCRTHTVYPICGNCDAWYPFLDSPTPEWDAFLHRYLLTPVRAGEYLSVVGGSCSRGRRVKKDGVSGWYLGRLEETDAYGQI